MLQREGKHEIESTQRYRRSKHPFLEKTFVQQWTIEGCL